MYLTTLKAIVIAIAVVLAPQMMWAQGLGVPGRLTVYADGSRGLLVDAVIQGGIADRLGIRAGDVIKSIHGLAVGDANTNSRSIQVGDPNSGIVVLRNGRQLVFYLNQNQRAVKKFPVVGNSGVYNSGAFNSVPGRIVPGSTGPNLNVDLENFVFDGSGATRVIVNAVGNGLGLQLGFRRGDIIRSVNNTNVRTVAMVNRLYVFNNQKEIVIGVVRNGTPGKIVIDALKLYGSNGPRGNRPGNGAGGVPAPVPITTPLELAGFWDQNRQVAVRSGTPGGLGTKLGLAARGTRIVEINGKAIRSPADLQTVDSMIQQGKVTRLQIKAIKPDGTSGVIVYPN